MVALISLFTILISILAIFINQWVTFVPRLLGIGFQYHRRWAQGGIAVLALFVSTLAFLRKSTLGQLFVLIIVAVLTPLSGFLRAGKALVSVDLPRHVPAADAGWPDDDLVISYEGPDGSSCAWALRSLIPHHLINDFVAGEALLVAWCEACRSGIVYAATVNGQQLTFEVECVWRRNMIMRDRETGSLWQHATGEALMGPLKGTQLKALGGEMMRWAAWRDMFPQTYAALEPEAWLGMVPRERIVKVLEGVTSGFVSPGRTPTDKRLSAHEPVAGITFEGFDHAYPILALQHSGAIEETVQGYLIRVEYDSSADHVRAFVNGSPLAVQRTWWMGWYEFHPRTTLYRKFKTS